MIPHLDARGRSVAVMRSDDAFSVGGSVSVNCHGWPRGRAGEKRMAALTRDLIDAASDLGGRYYLPYRSHATPGQFRRAYPRAGAFFAAKRRHDPDGLFADRFSEKYGP